MSVQPSHQESFQELYKGLEKVFFDKVAIESAIILLVFFFSFCSKSYQSGCEVVVFLYIFLMIEHSTGHVHG